MRPLLLYVRNGAGKLWIYGVLMMAPRAAEAVKFLAFVSVPIPRGTQVEGGRRPSALRTNTRGGCRPPVSKLVIPPHAVILDCWKPFSDADRAPPSRVFVHTYIHTESGPGLTRWTSRRRGLAGERCERPPKLCFSTFPIRFTGIDRTLTKIVVMMPIGVRSMLSKENPM
jgi:hypothetical protein